jgi:hypothetical protein
MIELLRRYNPDGTFGQMTLEDGSVFATVERPWLNNQVGISCIPEGVYLLTLRDSEVVNRTTHGRYKRGWNVTGVPNRSFIMIHIANFPRNVEGCIGVGLKQGFLAGEYAVLQSRDAFDRLMQRLAIRNEWYLEIKAGSQ